MDRDVPQFSIVVPVFNRAPQVAEILNSLSKQTNLDFEVIIADDGSNDNIREVCAAEHTFPVKLFHQQNSGGGAARNLGIDHASGEYIAFLDSDDFFKSNKLEVVAEYIERIPSDVYFSYATVDRGNGVTGRKPSRPLNEGERIDEFLLAAREPTQTSTLVVKTELARAVKFDPNLRKFQDIDFAIRLSHTGANFVFIPEELSVWTDISQTGRVGGSKNLENARSWILKNADILSERAKLGFNANLLTYELGPSHFGQVIFHVARAITKKAITPKRGAHSLARALIPKTTYRRIVDGTLKSKH